MEVTVQSMGLGCLLLLFGDGRGKFRGSVAATILASGGLGIAAMAHTRAGRLSVLTAVAVIFATSLKGKNIGQIFRRRLSLVGVIFVLGAIVATAVGVDLYERLSFDRFEGVSLENPDGTAEWRQIWWTSLYDVVIENNPTIGLGFGPNLADYNPLIGYQGDARPVRSPHNFNVTIFARMGILGTVIWIGIIFWGLIIPLWGAISQSAGMEGEADLQRKFWIAFLFAAWINSSLSVLMEGPVLGMAFWLVLGMVAGRRPATKYWVVHYAGASGNSANASGQRIISPSEPLHA